MKRFFACILVLTLLGGACLAENLFPDLTESDSIFPDAAEILGVEMPSLAAVLGRTPDSEEAQEDGGVKQVFTSVTNEDFNAFGSYLARCGCAIESYETVNRVFTAVVSRDGLTFTFRYDIAAQTAELTYPDGTWPEAFADEEPEPEASPAASESQTAAITPGSYVTFGRFEQDNDAENGPEPIEWLVLDVDETGTKAMLISRYILAGRQLLNDWRGYSAYEQATLRTWMNGEFIGQAFSDSEQAMVLVTEVDNGRSQGYNGIPSGSNTQDRVFLLSYAELVRYFPEQRDRMCAPTAFAARTVTVSRSYPVGELFACRWFLRSIQSSGRSYAVNYNGGIITVFADGYTHVATPGSLVMLNSTIGVRPVMWIDLTAGSLGS